MRLFISISILIATASCVYADRIVLVYGDVLEGRIVQETDTTITIQGPFGEQKFAKTDVQEIVRDEAPGAATAPGAPPLPPSQPAPDAGQPPPSAMPEPYEILRRNIEIQSSWKDLEIAYLQRAYLNQQTIQTQFIGRVIPPSYFRSKLTTPIPASSQFPQGGEIEYDMYRAKSTLYQAVKAPGQPIQYLKLDMNRIEGLRPGDNPVESFKAGFVGAGTDEELLAAVATHTRIIGTENTDGHDCWVLETISSPQLVDAQVRRQPAETQAGLRQQLLQMGYIRSWVGREDTIQWRMENYDSQGNLLLSMKMITVNPNQGLSVQDLRMKVPKGTEFIDVTDMVAGQFNQLVAGPPGIVPIPGPNELMGGAGPAQSYPSGPVAPGYPGQGGTGVMPPGVPQQALPPGAWPPAPQSYPQVPQQQGQYAVPSQPSNPFVPRQMPQQPVYPQGQTPGYLQQTPPMAPNFPLAPQTSPPVGYPANPPVYQVPPQAQVYPQPQVQYYQPQPGQAGPQAFQQTYVQQPGFQQPQQSSGVGSFLSRIFGGSRSGGQPPVPGGYNQSGAPTVMVPTVGGQPQFPTAPR
jgi:hypothetical protein